MKEPSVAISLVWRGDLRFVASAKGGVIEMDGDSVAGPSPVEALAFSLAGCMAADVASILQKGRHDLRGLETNLVCERAESHPRRVVRAIMRFTVTGKVPEAAIERAIALSRDKYCSVWHSLKSDIDLLTSHEVIP